MTWTKAVTKFAGDTKTGRTVNNKRPRSQRLLTKANAIKHYFERGMGGEWRKPQNTHLGTGKTASQRHTQILQLKLEADQTQPDIKDTLNFIRVQLKAQDALQDQTDAFPSLGFWRCYLGKRGLAARIYSPCTFPSTYIHHVRSLIN